MRAQILATKPSNVDATGGESLADRAEGTAQVVEERELDRAEGLLIGWRSALVGGSLLTSASKRNTARLASRALFARRRAARRSTSIGWVTTEAAAVRRSERSVCPFRWGTQL